MSKGVIQFMHEAKRSAEIKTGGKSYMFSYDVVEHGDVDALFEGLEVSFKINKDDEVTEVIPNRNQKRPEYLDYLQVSKDVRSCVFDYFESFETLLADYRHITPDLPQQDFLRMRRFLMTAYNDIRDIDGNVIDRSISKLKSEIDRVAMYYADFRKKSGYSIQYAYEKIFLTQQPKYNELVEKIAYTQVLIKRAVAEEKPLAMQIKSRETEFSRMSSATSRAFLLFEKSLKSLRKRYADLVHFLDKQRTLLARLLRLRVIYTERFFDNFKIAYEPLVKEFQEHLLLVLNVKAAELDQNIWTQAKQSKIVRNFFIKAGINGTYSSKTLLKYYLRSVNKEKAGAENLRLFALLDYLESISTKNIVIIRGSFDVANANKELLERFDKDLKISIIKDVDELFRPPFKTSSTKIDLILVEFEALGFACYPFIERYRRELGDANTTQICLLTRELSPNLMSQGKKLGVTHFLHSRCTDEEFIDAMREIL